MTCFFTIPNSISFGQPLSAVIHNNNIQFRYKLLFARFKPESTLIHTLLIAASALLNILQQKALIRTRCFFSFEARKHAAKLVLLPNDYEVDDASLCTKSQSLAIG